MAALGTSAFGFAAVALAAIGGAFIVAGLAALFRRRLLRFTLRTLTGLLLVVLGGLAAAIDIGTTGYRALTREDLATRIQVRPVGPQQFEATFRTVDRPEATYELEGDEIYIDAHILKWNPMANVLGLHTAYELDRVAGRYEDIADEQSKHRTVYSLAKNRSIDLFGLRRHHPFLAPLLDAEYGSGTFVPVRKAADFEVRVSTTGLLIREVKPD
jgi:hypothetical protein